jgi:hypothetical protein
VLAGGGLVVVVLVGWLGRHWLGGAAERLMEPSQVMRFAGNYVRLFSGTTVYRYIAGSGGLDMAGDNLLGLDFGPLDGAAWLMAGVAVLGLWQRIRSGQCLTAPHVECCLLAAWALCLAGFFLVAGPDAIEPHSERYGIGLIAPGALLLSLGLGWWTMPRGELSGEPGSKKWPGTLRGAAILGLAATGWLLLADCYSNYFDFIHRTGGRSHDTFRTAAVEPKQAALEHILRNRDPRQETWIVMSESWNYRPIRYLGMGTPGLRFERLLETWHRPEFQAALRQGRVWIVEFAGSEAHTAVRQQLQEQGIPFQEHLAPDYSGQPALAVLGPAPT